MADQKKRRRASRTRLNTLRLNRTYQVCGNVYSRLLYPDTDPDYFIPGPLKTLPMVTDNVLERRNMGQFDLSDYPLWSTKAQLLRRRKVLEEVSVGVDGQFRFKTELRIRRRYRMQITINFGARVYPERVTAFFYLRSLPKGLTMTRRSCRLLHQMKLGFKRWRTIDREKITCFVEGGTLHFKASGAIVFNTFALDMDWLSQHLSPGAGRNPKTLKYHSFTYNGKTYRIPLHHLCLATCLASCLRYYGCKINKRLVSIEDVAEAATRWYLDMRAGKHSELTPLKTLDTSQRDIVRFIDGSYPHNDDRMLLHGVKALSPSGSSSRKFLVAANADNLMTDTWPNIKLFLGKGWPTIIADDQKGNWEHARICRGLVVNHKGKMTHAYVNDPWRESRLRVSTRGIHSDLGWALVSLPLSQGEVTPKRLLNGGKLPAPRRVPP